MLNFITSLLLLVFILGIIVFVHEFGHFISAKKCGVYVAEFSIGMGPTIWKSKPKKGETIYSIRVFPIGGFVSMAEKDIEGKKLKKTQVLENKSFFQKFCVFIMGILFNFVFAIAVFFISGLIYGNPVSDPIIGGIAENSPAFNAGIEVGDRILTINDIGVSNWDDIILEISGKKIQEEYIFEIEKPNGTIKKINVNPIVDNKNGQEIRTFGIGSSEVRYEKGFANALKYGITGFASNFKSIFRIIVSLFNGSVALDSLSGPVGIYSVIDTLKTQGLQIILYLIAYLSVNVGIINLIPIPVFDGGRILIIIIEAITRKKSSEKLESFLNLIGFGIMILLMLYVTFNDIMRLIG